MGQNELLACQLSHLSCLLVFPSQLQAHMALQLCPVLGDHTYSARVGTVLGQRFLLPVESTKPQRQVPKLTCLQPSGVGWCLWGWTDGQHLQTATQLGLPKLPVPLSCCVALSDTLSYGSLLFNKEIKPADF